MCTELRGQKHLFCAVTPASYAARALTGPRTEPASARRLAEALAAGVRPISRDLVALLALAAACLGLTTWLPSFWPMWKRSLSDAMANIAAPTIDDTVLTGSIAGVKGLWLALLPVLGLITLASLLAWLVQGGFRFRSRSAAARVHTSSTAGLRTLWLCVKALVLVSAFASVIHHSLRAMLSTPTADLGYALRVLSAMTELLLSRVGVVLLLMMAADMIVQRFLWHQSLRMTRDELKRELRETEGDPTLRAERRGRQRQTALEP